MTVDGKNIAERVVTEVAARVREQGISPKLAIISMSQNRVTDSYVAIKRRVAGEAGVTLIPVSIPETADTDVVLQALREALAHADSIVLQLPFPPHIDVKLLLAELPQHKDPDGIGVEATAAHARGDASILPPVIGAIEDIARSHNFDFTGKQVVVVGEGRLVGSPAAMWLRRIGAHVTVITKDATDAHAHIQHADALILGAGSPGLVTKDMVKDGVAIFDAGTSEEGGKVVGDADPGCSERAALFTPVPGGIGPVAVAKLFENVLTLLEWRAGNTR